MLLRCSLRTPASSWVPSHSLCRLQKRVGRGLAPAALQYVRPLSRVAEGVDPYGVTLFCRGLRLDSLRDTAPIFSTIVTNYKLANQPADFGGYFLFGKSSTFFAFPLALLSFSWYTYAVFLFSARRGENGGRYAGATYVVSLSRRD